MTFLYGDCTPSPLRTNYLATLRRALSMSVEILLAEDRLIELARRRRSQRARADTLEARIEALRAAVRDGVGGVASAPEDDPVTRCANAIEHAVDAAVARAVDEIHAQDRAAGDDIAARERAAHGACIDAVAAFLREHELPDASRAIELSGKTAIARSTTPYGIAVELELDLAGTPFASPSGDAKVAAFAKTKKLDKLIVAHARVGAHVIEVDLRDGVEIVLDRGSGAVDVGGKLGASSPADDARALAFAIAALLEERSGGTLRAATLDDAPLDELEQPSRFVDRLLGAMAPAVAAIVERSQTPTELRLLRDLGDSRREEIFLTHAALADLVGQVPVARRRHFDVLRLPGVARAREATADVDPEMIVISEPSIMIDHGGDD
ncbi:MAG TPA: hypothetical protein VL463_15540 [Kofleriaceae bacterium]|nr:hypothetical protein [Kofleriaceae bacterium]